MPSAAHVRWTDYVGDPQDLLQRLSTAVAAGDPDPYALSRATVVSLAAAWETYVEHLALETGQWTLPPAQNAQLRTMVDGLNNPKPANVRRILALALGHDPWPHVPVTGKTEEQTRVTVGTFQVDRHEIAHGHSRPKYQESDLLARIRFFDELVGLLDQHFEAELTTRLGRSPW